MLEPLGLCSMTVDLASEHPKLSSKNRSRYGRAFRRRVVLRMADLTRKSFGEVLALKMGNSMLTL